MGVDLTFTAELIARIVCASPSVCSMQFLIWTLTSVQNHLLMACLTLGGCRVEEKLLRGRGAITPKAPAVPTPMIVCVDQRPHSWHVIKAGATAGAGRSMALSFFGYPG